MQRVQIFGRKLQEHAQNTAMSLLKLTNIFTSKLESIEKDTDEWISNLEVVWIWISKFRLKGNITDEDFTIHVLNNLPEEYNVILNGLDNHLTLSGDDMLTIEVICEKLKPLVQKD